MNHTFTEKDRIMKAKIDLNAANPFFSYILLNMNIKESKSEDRVPTMAVNEFGRLLWNEKFIKSLSDDELQGVLCHEAMHMVTLTFQRKGNRDMMLWNMASDLVINALITNDGVTLPKDCLLPDNNGNFEFTGKGGKKYTIKNVIEKTAEDIYDIFSSNAEQIQTDFQDGEGSGEGSYQGSFDHHDPEGRPEDGESESGGDGEDGEEQKTPVSEAEKNQNKEKWKKIATEASTQAKMRGKSNSHFERALGELLNPEIDWRAKLHQFITKDLPVDYTMRRPGRRFYTTGVYYPSIIQENLDVVIAIDTSGSISDKEYSKFMSEVIGIAKSFDQISMRILWWSTEVTDNLVVNKHDADSLIDYKFGSTGGTTMSCVADYCLEKKINSRVFVFLTDGYCESNPKLPDGKMLFVLSKGGSDNIVKEYGDVSKLRLN